MTHQMSGNTANASTSNITEEQIRQMLVDDKKRNEFGLFEFLNPYVQVPFERAQEEYMKKYKLKEAYNKQEFLRKMRTDIKREYLTRKKQLKRLQTDAAVAFREAETRLQEHYSNEFARIKGRRAVDISMPLVSCVEIREGETIDLKEFNIQQAFQGLCNMQNDIYQSEREGVIQFMRKREEEQRQREYEAANEASWNQWTQQQYQQRRPYAPRGEEQQQQQEEEEQPGRYGDGGYCGCDDLECSDCYSYGNENESVSSYDSEYCAEFGYYPREYNYERQMREDEEARVAQAARLRAEHEAEAAAEDAAEAERRRRWHDMSPEEEQQLWFENTRNSDGETWDEEAIEDEAEHRREVAQMKLNGDHPDVQQLEDIDIEVMEPKERFTASSAAGGMLSAQKKAAAGAAAKAAKARQAKQQQKKLQKKFAPLQVTDNTNRSNEVTAILTTNKLEINLPKKNLQNVSREGKRRHVAIWRRIEKTEKHASARGTRIANIPEPRFDGDID